MLHKSFFSVCMPTLAMSQPCASQLILKDDQMPHLVLQGNRGFAYAVLYAAMNVASLLSGWTLDLFRITLRDGFGISGRPADGILNSGYRLYLVLGKLQP